jgi:hypothetical protein
MAELIAAIESVVALPAYQAHALAQAPAIARLPAARGVFLGYDFHLTEAGPADRDQHQCRRRPAQRLPAGRWATAEN